MPHPVELHVPCPDAATGAALASAAIAARLAACANLSAPVTSHFHWQGKIENEEERILSFKTRSPCVEELVALIRDRHPYDLPAITWSEIAADPDTARWIAEETGD